MGVFAEPVVPIRVAMSSILRKSVSCCSCCDAMVVAVVASSGGDCGCVVVALL